MSSWRERAVQFGAIWRGAPDKETSTPPQSSVLNGATPHEDFRLEPTVNDGLARTIQAEIVPRLMLAHHEGISSPSGEPAYAVTPPGVDEVEELARLIIGRDPAVGWEYIEAMRVKGISVESVFLDLLTPVARMLGDMWLRDDCTFTDVTIGLSRLHTLVANLGPSLTVQVGIPSLPSPRAAFVEAPGEQHTFGLQLIREFFRTEGWDVWGGRANDSQELLRLVQDEWINVVGVSMSNVDLIPATKELVSDLRAASLNPNLLVMVGGSCVIDDPQVVQQVKADAGPSGPKEALAIARAYFDQLGSSHERH